MKIDGIKIAQEILNDLKKQIIKFKINPHLAIINIGENPSSLSYINVKKTRAKEIGAKVSVYNFSKNSKEQEIIKCLNKLNNEKGVHGIIVQLPLPENFDQKKIISLVNPDKDIDGFSIDSKFEHPVGMAVLEVLQKINELNHKKITILGRGLTGGIPIKKTLQKNKIKVNSLNSKTKNLVKIIKESDVIISAVGKREVIIPSMLKKGVILIGVGQHKEEDGKFYGDYVENKIKNIASLYTTTPGGIGPINVAALLKNLTIAALTN